MTTKIKRIWQSLIDLLISRHGFLDTAYRRSIVRQNAYAYYKRKKLATIF